MAVISALDDKPISDTEVRRTFHAISEAVAMEGGSISTGTGTVSERKTRETTPFSLRELFTGGRSQNFRRVMLGIVIQCFQQVPCSELSALYELWLMS
jgi:hypothetical protein